MIVTDRFVLLNFPRTGSTFARDAVARAYGVGGWFGAVRRVLASTPGFRELWLPIDRTETAARARRRSQHGAYSQIPKSARGLPVVSVVRCPYDRAVSLFEARFWRDQPCADVAALRARAPRFPDITFSEYLELAHEFGRADVSRGRPPAGDVGVQTLHHLKFYARDVDAMMACVAAGGVDAGAHRALLGEVRYLRHERLGAELADFLEGVGLEPRRVAPIRRLPPRNRARARAGRPWTDYFSPTERATFRRRERVLFELFPEYDVDPAPGAATPAAGRPRRDEPSEETGF